jgi:TonB family protein
MKALERKIDVRQSALVVACALGIVVATDDAYVPARYRTGAVPALPAMAVGGGQVIVELAIDRAGGVTAVTPLRTTPPFTALVLEAVRDWQFLPAEERAAPARAGESGSRMVVPSKVLVVAVFRPPAMNAPALGELPRDVARASEEDAFPLAISIPTFPPTAAGSGVVLLEARVNRAGEVDQVAVRRSAPPFDAAARAALKEWKFRPARVRAKPVSTFAYVVFGFPVPVGSGPPIPRGGTR